MDPKMPTCTPSTGNLSEPARQHAGMIGRQRELDELESLLLGCDLEPGPLVVVHGRRGVGKTTLAAALAQRACAHHIDVVWAAGSPLVDVPEGSLVILDDARDVDDPTLERLKALTAASSSLRLLVLCRGARYRMPPGLTGWLDRAQTERSCRFLMLRPLAPEAADTLVRAACGRCVPADVVADISHLSAGDPSLIGEFARVLCRDPSDEPSADVPETVAGLVALRLATLDAGQRHVAELASLFSGGFAIEWLAHVVKSTESDVLTAIRATEDAGLVEQSGDDRFEMSAPVVRDAVLSLAFGGNLQRAHRRLAEALLALPEDVRTGAAAETARQFHSSRELPGADRGVEPALQAAGYALATRSPFRAAELLELGLELAVNDRPATQARLTGALAKSWASALCHAKAVPALEHACQRMRAAGATGDQIAELVIDVSSALPLGIACVDAAAPERIRILVDEVNDSVGEQLQAELYSRHPQMTTPAELGDRMVRVAMAGDSRRRSAALFRAAAETAEVLLNPSLTRPLLQQAAEEATLLGSRSARSLAYALQAVAAGRAGDRSSAAELAQAGVDAYARLGRPSREPPFAQLVQLLTQTQDAPDWDRLASAARRLVADHWPTPYAVSLTAVVALARVRAGDRTGCRTALLDVITALESVPQHLSSTNAALGPAVEAAWRLEDRTLGKRLLPVAKRMLSAGGGDFYMSQRDLAEARLALLSGRRDAARTAYGRALERLEEAAERTLRPVVVSEYEQLVAGPGGSSTRAGDRLTQRQLEVLLLLSEGLTNQQIADRLVVSINTVNRHVADIYRKIGAANRVAAAAYVARHGLAP